MRFFVFIYLCRAPFIYTSAEAKHGTSTHVGKILEARHDCERLLLAGRRAKRFHFWAHTFLWGWHPHFLAFCHKIDSAVLIIIKVNRGAHWCFVKIKIQLTLLTLSIISKADCACPHSIVLPWQIYYFNSFAPCHHHNMTWGSFAWWKTRWLFINTHAPNGHLSSSVLNKPLHFRSNPLILSTLIHNRMRLDAPFVQGAFPFVCVVRTDLA